MMRFLKLRKRLTDRKGAAVEMAVLLAVVVFSLSVLLLTTSLLQHSTQLRARESMDRSMVLEQIGADFCAAAGQTEHVWIDRYPDYTITVADLTMTVTEKDSDEVLLVVALAQNGDQYTITRWSKK